MAMAENGTPVPSVVRAGAGTQLILWGGFPVLGAGAGWLLSRLPGWLTQLPEWVFALPVVPGPEQVALLAGLEGTVFTVVLTVLGMVGGALLALLSQDELAPVEVGPETVALRVGEERSEIDRARVGAVFVDGKDLVLLGTDTAELVRKRTDHPEERLRAAFTEQGYPWHDGDPHADAYRRWLDGMPGLDQHAHAVLRARQAALKEEEQEDVAELRTELARLGVVVREEGHRQYWRTTRQIRA